MALRQLLPEHHLTIPVRPVWPRRVRALRMRGSRHRRVGANALAEARRDDVDPRQLIRESMAIRGVIQIQGRGGFGRQGAIGKLRPPHRRRRDGDDRQHD